MLVQVDLGLLPIHIEIASDISSSSYSYSHSTYSYNTNSFTEFKIQPRLVYHFPYNNSNNIWNDSHSSLPKSKRHFKAAASVNLRSTRPRFRAMSDPLTNGAARLRHVSSLAAPPSKVSRLNAVVLGDALASEEDDLVIPNPDFSAQAHVPSPGKVLFLSHILF